MLASFGVIAFASIALLYFAGTAYWQGWLYWAVLFVPLVFVVLYFMDKDPEFLERRMQYREKEKRQREIISAGFIIYAAGLILIAADRYYAWSEVPVWLVLVADALSLAGYGLVFLVFRENVWASRVIEVVPGQELVTTGPYAYVRHPMYLGSLAMTLVMPVALGTWYPILLFLLYIPVIVLRIFNEEDVLKRELAGYAEYCNKVKFRLIPGIW